MKLSDKQIDELRNKFLGQKISLTDGDGDKWVGIANFIGHNPFFPSWGLQITIGRTPITNVKIDSIKLYKK